MTPPSLCEPRSRRGHRKVRTGCATCKRRKIKCDEVRPTCGNCIKHGVDCDFPLVDSSRWNSQSSHRDRIQTTSPSPVFQQLPLSLNPIHLELLHNYTALTSHTLSNDPILRNIWRISVPQVGFSHDYVMRSILAFSALHMSRYSGSKSGFYLHIARSEHGVALKTIASMLSHATAENCSALYISAVLTFFYVLAAPRETGNFFLVRSSGIAEWIVLLQGVRSICSNWSFELLRGPFGVMFRLGYSRVERDAEEGRASAAWRSTNEYTQLNRLRRIISQAAISNEDAAVLATSIDELEKSYWATFSGSSGEGCIERSHSTNCQGLMGSSYAVAPTSNVYAWVFKMNERYIHMLYQKSQLALVVFAHFCVLLRFLGSYWWMQGWSTDLLQEIWDLLDEEHRVWIRWPIEELGWLPHA